MTTTTRHLERAALRAHEQNMPWSTFWETISDRVKAAEPINRERYRRLYNRLMHIALTGDRAGQEPPGDVMPWIADDQQAVADTGTEAKLLWEPGR